jgi:hypothetical protein
VIDIDNDTEIWAEENNDPDFDYEAEDVYDSALLDLDTQVVNGIRTTPPKSQTNSKYTL